MKVTITRRSKVGFGYETQPTGNDPWSILPTTSPNHTGTVKTVLRKIEQDKYFESLQSGTYHTTAWFVRIGGYWRKLSEDNWQSPADLLGPHADNMIQVDVI